MTRRIAVLGGGGGDMGVAMATVMMLATAAKRQKRQGPRPPTEIELWNREVEEKKRLKQMDKVKL